ncbi:class I SAM-dependent methyltransferase [Paracoccus caeni]|uniref:Class I SAM-dependent methyltransferase n=1 Tax=Paracoccus caeni TaxID=657651 RepID=A0A934W1J8_9RHOB|nr:class I SAM-dependent methyltransferase [Paracoccus caeni]MBK4217458.1 class I SAM-dependent methyltransferase [Paracoccus caeni]
MQDQAATPDAFWEEFYQTKRTTSTGQPSKTLARFATDLPPGTALDLGSSHGDDVIWLASLGWQALGVDISPVAVGRAARRAEEQDLSDRARFEARDLSVDFPAGQFDLVTAFYFQSPVHLPRAEIVGRAARAVAPGGHLLVVAHGAPPPWANHSQSEPFPTVESELAAAGYNPTDWTVVEAKLVDRPAKTPSGDQVTLQDTIIILRRNSAG